MTPASAFADRLVTVILNPLIFLLFSVAFLFFIWGLTVFIWKTDSEDGRKTGIRTMIWGIVGLFVMLSALAIIKIIQGTFGL